MTTEALTPEKLDSLERLLEAATPGPWINTGDVETMALSIATDPYADTPAGPSRQWPENCALIVAAVNSLPALLAIARREERLRDQIKAIEHPCHEACVGNLHADCQCAAWMRQEALAALIPEEGRHD